MKANKFIYFFIFLLTLTFWIIPKGWAQPKPTTSPPVITHSFAVEKGYYGYIWKIYIDAEDPDGDMFKIASVVRQIGYGSYPADWIVIKPQYRKHLKGYIQWNTFSSKAPFLREWTNITLEVSIIDKAGNESNVVLFPFEFVSGIKSPYLYKLTQPFDQGDLPKLGNIFIDLFEPTLGDDGKFKDD
ncbi:MAG: hypothetical protein AB1502_03420 [Thermodesulfobacteriota bacterium]